MRNVQDCMVLHECSNPLEIIARIKGIGPGKSRQRDGHAYPGLWIRKECSNIQRRSARLHIAEEAEPVACNYRGNSQQDQRNGHRRWRFMRLFWLYFSWPPFNKISFAWVSF